jgi:hypothetical protein
LGAFNIMGCYVFGPSMLRVFCFLGNSCYRIFQLWPIKVIGFCVFGPSLLWDCVSLGLSTLCDFSMLGHRRYFCVLLGHRCYGFHDLGRCCMMLCVFGIGVVGFSVFWTSTLQDVVCGGPSML